MNYYSHHIGDFSKETKHLSRLERSIYRDMKDLYFDTEKPLTADFNMLCRKLMARDEQESTCVQHMLNEFFTPVEQGWKHDVWDAEIKKWHARGWFPSDPSIPKNRPGIDEWKFIRERIFARDNYTCAYCEQVGGALECDHIVAVSLGGNSEDINLVTSCKQCNREKGNKTTAQWHALLTARKGLI